jgi:acetyltransferase-like isoleucine patch superfamily enzyme
MAENGPRIHSHAIVEGARIGDRTRVWAFVHILPGAQIGENCNICDHCFIENDVVLGDNVTVKCGIYLWDGIRVEDDVFLGPNVVFTNDVKPRSKRYPDSFEKTFIRRGASIGANSVILAGVEIGRYAMVGMGAVVTRPVPDYGLAYGNPARLKGYVCECAESLDFKDDVATCVCGRRYAKGERVERISE